MKVLKTFKKELVYQPTDIESQEAVRLLNLHYIGEENCNVYDGESNKLVAKYPEFEKDHPEFGEAHWNVRKGTVIEVELELLVDGTVRLKKS